MKFRLSIPMLVAAFAVGVMGVSASAASAHQFLAYHCLELGAGHKYETEPECLGIGAGVGGSWERVDLTPVRVLALSTNDQGFEIAGAVSVCKHAHFATNGTVTSPAETLLVGPSYSECEAEVGGTVHKVTVLTTGCDYVFHAAAPSKAEGKVDIECETGKEIVVHVEGLEGCEIKIKAQTGLGTVEYVNEAGGKVKVNAKVTGITFSSAKCPAGVATSGTNGIYREGKFSKRGEPELGTGAASALAEGFNSSGELIGVLDE
jgi:hypothetical protein